MESRALEFLEKYQVDLASIYIDYVRTKGIGAIFIHPYQEGETGTRPTGILSEAAVNFFLFDTFPDELKKEYLLQMRDIEPPPGLQTITYTLKPQSELIMPESGRLCYVVCMKDAYYLLGGKQTACEGHHYFEFKTVSPSIAEYNRRIAALVPAGTSGDTGSTGTGPGPNEALIEQVVKEMAPKKTSNWRYADTPQAAAYLRLCPEPDFRRKREFTDIIKQGTQEQGEKYIQYLETHYKMNTGNVNDINLTVLDDLAAVVKNDAVGQPRTHHFKKNFDWEELSCDTLRHWFTVLELNKYFKVRSASGEPCILEIGAGYGGLANVLLNLCPNVAKYVVVEEAGPLELCRTTLSAHSDEVKRVEFHTMKTLTGDREYDLVISEYALSELDAEGIDFYFENVVKHCSMLYIAWNKAADKNALRERLDSVFDIIVEVPEYPAGDWPNYRLFCKGRRM